MGPANHDNDLRKMLSSKRLAGARLPLERAETLPAWAYTSTAVYGREVERLFQREWLCAGRVDQVPDEGDFLTLDLLGRKLMVVRGTDGEIRVLSRVCRHRFAELVNGRGNKRSFQCPYHAWTYRTDGSLVGAPMMDEVEFDKTRCRLPEFKREIWQGWIFVNFDEDAEALAPRLAPLAKLFDRYRMGDMVATDTASYDSRFNWKVLVENFMESYHHIATHRNTLEPIFPAKESWALDNEGPYSVLRMPSVVEGGPLELPSVEGLEDFEERTLQAAVVYPFHLFALSPDSMSWYQILPDEVGRFELRIHTCFPRTTFEDPSVGASCQVLRDLTKAVHAEDIAACEAVWQGVSAEGVPPGRLHRLEKAIWQMNQWWIGRMVDGEAK